MIKDGQIFTTSVNDEEVRYIYVDKELIQLKENEKLELSNDEIELILKWQNLAMSKFVMGIEDHMLLGKLKGFI